MARLTLLAITYLCGFAFSETATGPTVDLGSALYKPTVAPISGNVYYNFSNIRFAAPPIDSLRFTPPQQPTNNRSAGVQDGSYGNICPQAFPTWLITALTINKVEYYNGIGAGQTQSEDCLFLDVILYEKVFKDASQGNVLKPVLIWIYGGGWVSGDKRSLTDPIGLLENAEQDLIFVAANYRLGAFGFLAGPSYISQGGTPNLGLLDQEAAFKWVQSYIHLFGGDAKKVTLMGESAGAGSILYHLAAGTDTSSSDPLFERVIPQSPVILPHSETEIEKKFELFLETLDVKTLDGAKSLSTKELMQANKAVVADTYYASYDIGPAVSGSYVKQWPNRQIATHGTNITAFVGHNSDEGKLFVYPKIKTNADFEAYVSKKVLSFLTRAQIAHVLNILYPPKYDGSQPYNTVQTRLALLIGEAFISCNAHILAKHSQGPSYGYIFDVPPGLHGQDIAYSFYTPDLPAPFVEYKGLASKMQSYLTRFARKGDPNDKSVEMVPDYQSEAKVLNIKPNDFKNVEDDAANARCKWWAENI